MRRHVAHDAGGVQWARALHREHLSTSGGAVVEG
jgi:hypothetical protein